MPKLNLHTARAGKFAVRLSITAARAAGCSGGDLMADLAVGYGKVQEAVAKDPEFAQVQARA